MWCYEGKTMFSYADKKKKSTKIVLVQTMMHDKMRSSKDGRRKPEPIVYFDQTDLHLDIAANVCVNAVGQIIQTRRQD